MTVTRNRAPGALRRLAEAALDFTFPLHCLGCEQLVPSHRLHGAGKALSLCPTCLGRLRPAPSPACPGCGRPLAVAPRLAGSFPCGRCRRRPPAWDRLFALWSYERPLDRVVQALKYRRLDYLGPAIGRASLERLPATLEEIDLVVPVPLAPWRRLVRGFNQAELLARPIAAALDRPLETRALRRRAATPQSLLVRAERQRNLRGAFRARRGFTRRWGGTTATALLVDDVVTTGATLGAAAGELRRLGVDRVWALAIARTPRPEELED